jgi:hypothetical protein
LIRPGQQWPGHTFWLDRSVKQQRNVDLADCIFAVAILVSVILGYLSGQKVSWALCYPQAGGIVHRNLFTSQTSACEQEFQNQAARQSLLWIVVKTMSPPSSQPKFLRYQWK